MSAQGESVRMSKFSDFVDFDLDNMRNYKISNKMEQDSRLKALTGKGNIAKMVLNFLRKKESELGSKSEWKHDEEESKSFIPYEKERDHLGRLNIARRSSKLDEDNLIDRGCGKRKGELKVKISDFVSPKFRRSDKYKKGREGGDMYHRIEARILQGRGRGESGEDQGLCPKLPNLHQYVRNPHLPHHLYLCSPEVKTPTRAAYTEELHAQESAREQVEKSIIQNLRSSCDSSSYIHNLLPNSQGTSAFKSAKGRSFWEKEISQAVPPVGHYNILQSSFHTKSTQSTQQPSTRYKSTSNARSPIPRYKSEKVFEGEHCQIEIQTIQGQTGIAHYTSNINSVDLGQAAKPHILRGKAMQRGTNLHHKPLIFNVKTKRWERKPKEITPKTIDQNPHNYKSLSQIKNNTLNKSIEKKIEIDLRINQLPKTPKKPDPLHFKSESIGGCSSINIPTTSQISDSLLFPPTVKNVVNLSKQLSREDVSYMRNYHNQFKEKPKLNEDNREYEMNLEFARKYKPTTTDRKLYKLQPMPRDERKEMEIPAKERIQFKTRIQNALNIVNQEQGHSKVTIN